MDRQVWTDERLDDMVDRLDKKIDRLERNIDLFREEMRASLALMDARMADGFTTLRRDMLATVLTMTGALVATMATVIATNL